VLTARGRLEEAQTLIEGCVPRIMNYGQMESWRKRSAEQLRQRLRTRAMASAGG